MSDYVPTSLRINVYNYKGGAGKSTTVVNVGAALAMLGLKVLLVDLDAQCNTSQFYHDDDTGTTLGKADTMPAHDEAAAAVIAALNPTPRVLGDQLHPTAFAASMDALVDMQHGGDRNTLFCIFDHFFTKRNVDKTQEVVDKGFEGLHCCNPDSYGDKLWLLEGTPLLWKFEEKISQAFANPQRDESLREYGIVSFILESYTRACGFDVIIVDSSPSNSALNKAAGLACDYILPPCQAGLYSAGSIHGLLSTVLPGRRGWLGMHKIISNHWRNASGDPNPDEPEALNNRDWLLPKDPPKLLPILITNYGLEVSKEEGTVGKEAPATKRRKGGRGSGKGGASAGGRGSPSSSDAEAETMVMKFSPSQFVYTIMHYIYKECRFVAGSERQLSDPPPASDALVQFMANHGQKVIAFAPASPIAMPVAEQAGRAFAELSIDDFTDYYDKAAQAQAAEAARAENQAAEAAAAAAAAAAAQSKAKGKQVVPPPGFQKRPPSKKRALERESNHSGLVHALKHARPFTEGLEDGSFAELFNKELELLRSRYQSLADWLKLLLEKKREEATA